MYPRIAYNLLFIGLLCGFNVAYYTPLYLWGVESVSKPSLRAVSMNEFKDIIAISSQNRCIVAFVEQYLSAKDLICQQLDANVSCFQNMQSYSPHNYYAKVQQPISVLNMKAKKHFKTWVDSNGELSSPLHCSSCTVNYIYFDDTRNETREQMLTWHDQVIAYIYRNMLEWNCSSIYLYFSEMETVQNPNALAQRALKRKRRETNNGYIFSTDFFTIYFQKLELVEDKTTTELVISNMSVVVDSNTLTVTMAMTANETLVFNVNYEKNYFNIRTVNYMDKVFHSAILEMPPQFSYVCSKVRMKYENYYLIWTKLQFEGPRNKAVDTGAKTAVAMANSIDKYTFQEAWHCIGFMSPAIASGIFVTALIASIVFCGIGWIANINTCDRYENPNKPSINIRTNI